MELPEVQKAHKDAMYAIATAMSSTPMVLKGGTALLLCYGLDRFSEDLDFDCPKKLSLENKVKTALLGQVDNLQLKLLKDGECVTRYRLTGQTPQGELSIKIETSHRDEIKSDDVVLINGIQVYKLAVLAGLKLRAAEARTASRDLYDLHFIARKDIAAFQGDDLEKLRALTADTDSLLSKYQIAFAEDPLLYDVDPAGLILELAEMAKRGLVA